MQEKLEEESSQEYIATFHLKYVSKLVSINVANVGNFSNKSYGRKLSRNSHLFADIRRLANEKHVTEVYAGRY